MQKVKKTIPEFKLLSDNLYKEALVKQVFQKVKEKQYYIIMDKFGDSLRNVHERLNNKFSFKTTAQIGIKLVKIL